MLCNEMLRWQTPLQISGGGTPDISHILAFKWMEPVLYHDPETLHPETKEDPGYFVGFGENVGDALTFIILTQDRKQVLHRSVVRAAIDPKRQNRRVKWKDLLPVMEPENPYEHPKQVLVNSDSEKMKGRSQEF